MRIQFTLAPGTPPPYDRGELLFVVADRALEQHRTAVLRRACLETCVNRFEMTECEKLLMNELVKNRNRAYADYNLQ